jgi:predicted membrane protein
MSDFETRREERRQQREEVRRKIRERWGRGQGGIYSGNTRGGSIWTGVFIILIGIAALIKVTVTDLPNWVFSWQMFLIVLGFFIGIRHGFRGPAWFILMLVGGAFLATEINPDINIRRYIWPVALIVVGGFLVLRPRHRNFRDYIDDKVDTAINDAAKKEGPVSDDDFVDSTSVFGGAHKNIISKNFKGGDLVNIFGGTELNLTQADFTGTATIELTTIFGGTKLIVPSNWSVKSEVVTIFGGMEDKRNIQSVTDNSGKLLLLRGTIIFGGIEIKSF